METKLTEIEMNILTLKWLEEDYGYLVDVALETIIPTIEKLVEINPEVALELSKVFANEDFWGRAQDYAYAAYLENLQETN